MKTPQFMAKIAERFNSIWRCKSPFKNNAPRPKPIITPVPRTFSQTRKAWKRAFRGLAVPIFIDLARVMPKRQNHSFARGPRSRTFYKLSRA